MAAKESDPDDFSPSPEQIVELHEAQRRGRGKSTQSGRTPKAKRGEFVQLPYAQVQAITARRDASMAVLVELAYRKFKTKRNMIPLANATLRSVGVSPDAKTRALRRLEIDGLIKVDWR